MEDERLNDVRGLLENLRKRVSASRSLADEVRDFIQIVLTVLAEEQPDTIKIIRRLKEK